jgi:membrane associated rhomboid family serine protease
MSTPPPLPDDTRELSPQPPKRIRLAPIAVVLVVIIILSFGVCAANLNLNGPAPPIASVAIGVEIAGVVGLVVLAVIAITRRRS